MDKPAPTDHPILDITRQRWSPRAFDARPVPREVLLSLLEAARWTASSSNEQPWSFLVTTKDDAAEHARAVACLVPGNQSWAKNAPVLGFTVARLAGSRGGPNRLAFHDVGQAIAQLVLEAASRGIQVHQMGGIDVAKVRETYAIPETHEPVAGFVLGYPGDPDSLPPELKARESAPRVRRPLAETVFGGKFGQASPLLK